MRCGSGRCKERSRTWRSGRHRSGFFCRTGRTRRPATFCDSPTWRGRCATWRTWRRRRGRRGPRVRRPWTRCAITSTEAISRGASTPFRRRKAGFWSQGPSMIEALNILEGYDLAGMQMNSADYIHTMVETLKLAYADRDTYYGDPKFNHIPTETLLSKEYGAERRKLIGENASLEFRPGKIGDHPPQHPSLSQIAHYKMDPALKAKDTTCVDAIDQDGVAISITPSGGWMPAYIAGDTGIPLTQRAQSFLLIPGHPNELGPGKRPRVTLSPTIVVGPGKNLLTLSTPGGDQQDQALLQVLFNAVEFGLNAQAAVEHPRFQSEHLVESF